MCLFFHPCLLTRTLLWVPSPPHLILTPALHLPSPPPPLVLTPHLKSPHSLISVLQGFNLLSGSKQALTPQLTAGFLHRCGKSWQRNSLGGKQNEALRNARVEIHVNKQRDWVTLLDLAPFQTLCIRINCYVCSFAHWFTVQLCLSKSEWRKLLIKSRMSSFTWNISVIYFPLVSVSTLL